MHMHVQFAIAVSVTSPGLSKVYIHHIPTAFADAASNWLCFQDRTLAELSQRTTELQLIIYIYIICHHTVVITWWHVLQFGKNIHAYIHT